MSDPPSGERCDTCKFYIKKTFGAAQVFECRYADPERAGRWPTVLADDWCGKWEAIAVEANHG
jgi:hypothetical protein